MEITTNHVPRDVITGYELTPREQAEFDYLDFAGEYSHSFVRYKGELVYLDEFLPIIDPINNYWDGYEPNTFFSGLLIKWVDSMERVVVGRYCT